MRRIRLVLWLWVSAGLLPGSTLAQESLPQYVLTAHGAVSTHETNSSTPSGTVIATGLNSTADLTLASGAHLTVGAMSRLRVGGEPELIAGSLVSFEAKGSEALIRTSSVRVRVTGALSGMSYKLGTTIVQVGAGRAKLTILKNSETEWNLSPGESATISPGGTVVIAKLQAVASHATRTASRAPILKTGALGSVSMAKVGGLGAVAAVGPVVGSAALNSRSAVVSPSK
jgi:hypothetical protein